MTGNGKILLFFFGAILSLSAAQNWWQSGISVDITLQNFDEIIGKDKHVVVDVYAQFCGYCRMMQPDWDRLAERYMGADPARRDIIIAKMDGGIEPDLSNRFGVNGFPSFLLFKKGEVFPSSRYNGERTVEHFTRWIEGFVGEEEKAPMNEVKEDQAFFELLNEIQRAEIQDDGGLFLQPDLVEHVRHENHDQNMDVIVQKLDLLVDIMHNNNGRHVGSEEKERDLSEIKSLITDLDHKIGKKSPVSEEEINFSHGMIFILLGVFLGIGISFGITNYQKLAHSRKFLD
jgi:thiol-disulfide isomerase/thioredoxin